MLVSQIREARDAKQFRSFTIAIRGGQRVNVNRPGDVFIPRVQTSGFVVVLPKGVFRLIDASDVTKMVFRGRPGRGTSPWRSKHEPEGPRSK